MNPILEKIEEIGTTVNEYQKTNDERIAELKKGNEGTARELAAKLDKMDEALNASMAARKELEKEAAIQKSRIELLEAQADMPKGTPQEQFDKKYSDLFLKAMRSRFEDQDTTNELRDTIRKAQSQKDVIIGTTISGGFGVPKVIANEIEHLMLKQSEIVANVKNVTVGTSDYQELVSIFGGTSGWVAEEGSRAATGTPKPPLMVVPIMTSFCD